MTARKPTLAMRAERYADRREYKTLSPHTASIDGFEAGYRSAVRDGRELRKLLATVVAHPGVRELFAPSGSLGSVMDRVDAALRGGRAR
jgi:hypothetical protein